MFVYQNKDNAVCITFQDNKPVEAPEYVITVDKEAKTLTIAGANVSTEGSDVVETNYKAELDSANATIEELTAAAEADAKTITELQTLVADLQAQLEAANSPEA